MSLVATNYKGWLLCCLFLLSNPLQANVNPSREDRVISQKYKEMLKAEREGRSPRDHYESLAAGVAALFIGIYGYYNDNRGTLGGLVNGCGN
jgi:hypothetical protein